LEYYKFVKLIGKGAFGKVTLGIHKLTGKSVAIKTIEKSYMKDDFSKKKVFQEVYLLKKIRHSNVIKLLEVFESSKHLLMVMEFAGGGDLLKLIKRKGRLAEGDAKFIFKQIVYGLAHIHCRSVIHRDVKLDNILLDCEKGVKICDFGVSKIIKKGQVIAEQCGTPAYLAPEIIIDKGYEGFFVDIWSLGVLLYAMLCGTVPFKAQNLEDLHKLILKGEFTFACDLSQEAQSLIKSMLKLEPKARITIPQTLAHAWLKETNEDDSDEEEEEDSKENNGKGAI
jgi:serine/threonine protein kinase